MTFDQNSNNPFSVMYPIISIADIKEQMKGGLIPAFRDTFIHFLFATLGNEYLLLDFVNSVLENDGQPLIKSITVQNPFNPKTFVVDKNSILDFKAISEDGNVFVVEFQTGERSFFTDRMLYYCSRTYSSQLHEGVAYTLLHRVIGISLVTYILFSNLISPHNSFFLRATSNHDVIFSEGMQMHVLELAEAKVGLFSQLKTNLRCWMIFFYYADKKSEEEMSLLLRDNPRVENAYIEYKRFNASSELREL
ncbi:MAG: Rpn family recombination-promoting nuclease/putative transposase, partial [Planctomycetaceae bacterium]|nr:Rpn family recombination-promoting nuclease/putative transposase [Planctomycetaceae bacterium]